MSKIEWTDKTWNPTRGCSRVSPGCDNCYAISQALRHDWCKQRPDGTAHFGLYHGLTTLRRDRYDWTGIVRFAEDMLSVPLQRQKPTWYFVGSMSDIFHDSLTNLQVAMIFAVMAACPQHRFQVLTKRPGRALTWFNQTTTPLLPGHTRDECVRLKFKRALSTLSGPLGKRMHADVWQRLPAVLHWPLPNVHFGVSAENQATANDRVALLKQIPAAVRFVSAEPLLGPIAPETFDGIDGVIVGGESGAGARSCEVGWVRDIVEHRRRQGSAVFVKQLGACPIGANGTDSVALQYMKSAKGGDPAEWPEDLRVRQWPGEAAA